MIKQSVDYIICLLSHIQSSFAFVFGSRDICLSTPRAISGNISLSFCRFSVDIVHCYSNFKRFDVVVVFLIYIDTRPQTCS